MSYDQLTKLIWEIMFNKFPGTMKIETSWSPLLSLHLLRLLSFVLKVLSILQAVGKYSVVLSELHDY